MSDGRGKKLLRIAGRVVIVVAMAYTVGYLLNRSAQAIDKSQTPAGFGRGVVHGAMMPCAMPNLILGRDVSIYTQNNNGRPYKLGYTVGVNACGALFFGLSYFRFNRWRRQASRTASETGVDHIPSKENR